MYQIYESLRGDSIVFRVADSAWIPMDEGNADYEAYLAWVAAGNTPEVIEP